MNLESDDETSNNVNADVTADTFRRRLSESAMLVSHKSFWELVLQATAHVALEPSQRGELLGAVLQSLPKDVPRTPEILPLYPGSVLCSSIARV